MPHVIVVRLTIDASDQRIAEAVGAEAATALFPCGAVVKTSVERYWKIPEQFLASLRIGPTAEASGTFDLVLSLLGNGWDRHEASADQAWAVWNPHSNASFFSPYVRWGSVELFSESAIIEP